MWGVRLQKASMELTKLSIMFGCITICVLVAVASMLSYTEWPFTDANKNFVIMFGVVMGSLSGLPVLLVRKNLVIKISRSRWLATIILLVVSMVFEYIFITLAFVA